MKSAILLVISLVCVLAMVCVALSDWQNKMYVFYPLQALGFIVWMLLMREIVKRKRKIRAAKKRTEFETRK